MIISVDTDGVLRNIADECIKIYKDKYDKDCNITHDTFYHWDMKSNCPKVDNDEQFFIDNAYSIFELANTYKERKDLCSRLKAEGHYVAIATHQFKGIEQFTLNWFNKINIPYDSIHFVKDKSLIRADYLIDDKPENLYKAKEAGIKPLCVIQPWNIMKYNGVVVTDTESILRAIR